MTNEEKILAMLAEMQTEIKNLKEEITALRPHIESKEEIEARQMRLREFLKNELTREHTPEENAEGEELARIYYENKRNSANAIIDAGRRVAS